MAGLPDPMELMNSWYPIIIAVVVGVLYTVRQYFRGARCTSPTHLKDKVVIITGASAGIGRNTAIELAKKGAKVYIACRQEDGGAAVVEDITKFASKKLQIIPMHCDLNSFTSIRAFVGAFRKKEDNLHILINNAGVMMCPQGESEDGFETHFATNYLGAFLLTQLLLDTLKHSAPSRIVNLVAPAYKLGKINFDDVNWSSGDYVAGDLFAQSKLALMMFSMELHKQLQGSNVSVYAANPGVSNTDIHRHMVFKRNSFVYVSFALPIWFLMKNAEDGAQTPVYCAVAESAEKNAGKYFSECGSADVDPAALYEEQNRKLWDMSVKWTGLDKVLTEEDS